MEADQNEEKVLVCFFCCDAAGKFLAKKDHKIIAKKQRRNCDTILRIREKRKTFHMIFFLV